jgi:tRNA threonylcarbamoyladenosine biosynthesis protein TsaB
MKTLIIETGTDRGLIALTENEQIKASIELPFGFNQSKLLMPELQKMFSDQSISLKDIDCVATGIGPGSYTGIRIGVSVAKALAYAGKIPLIGFSSLFAFIPETKNISFAALIDAKIGGAYFLKGHIDLDGTFRCLFEPAISSLDELGDQLKDVSLIVSPSIKSLKNKMDQIYPPEQWDWQEIHPSPVRLTEIINQKYLARDWSEDGHLDLLYLRKTEAEIEKERSYLNHPS